METTVTDLPDSRVKIEARITAEELEGKIRDAARDVAGEMRVPGFRKGKVPAEIVIQRVGREAVLEQALRDGLPEWYERAVIDAGVAAVGEPELDMPEPPAAGEPLDFTIEIGVLPQAKLGTYRGLEVGKAEPEVPDEAIDAELEQLRESLGSLTPVERPAGAGDFLLVDYRGEIDGEPIEGGEATDELIELGSERLIEGFNEALEGVSAGEQRTVEARFGDDYQVERLAGREASFSVTVKEVREKRLPELDDDFALESSGFDTLAELREDIASKLGQAVEQRAEADFREATIDAAVDEATIDVPEAIIAARAKEMWERFERSLESRGISPETYLRAQGKSREQMLVEAREQAERGLRREAVLAAVAEEEGIEVGEEELLEAVRPPAGVKGKPEKLLKRIRKEGREPLLTEDVRMRKAAELIASEAQPIPLERAEARKRLWTPEEESSEEAEPSRLWTPGD